MILLPERSPPGGSSSSTRRRLAAYQSLPDGESRARRERKGALNGGGGRLEGKSLGTSPRRETDSPFSRLSRGKKRKKRKQQTIQQTITGSFSLFFFCFFSFSSSSTRVERSLLRGGDRKLHSLLPTQGYASHSAKGIAVFDSFAILSRASCKGQRIVCIGYGGGDYRTFHHSNKQRAKPVICCC